jgi:hypothetical protein
MNKALYVQKIMNNVSLFDVKKLKEIDNFIKFLKYRDYIDPTLEILSNEVWYKKTLDGIKEKENGEVVSWESVK